MEMIDVHAHINDECFVEDLDEVVLRANESGIKKIICSAYDLESSKRVVEITKKYDNVFGTVGIHPENVNEGTFENDKIELIKLAQEEKIVAIGEIGLDYHFVSDNKELQKRVFVDQIKIANQLDKPVVIHSRDAMGDTIEILQKNRLSRESLLHCYSGSFESAKILIKLGFSFSFGGVVTFNNAKNVLDVVSKIPMENILLETDCPYMSPVPFRGKRNEPKNIVYIADKISKIKNVEIEKIAEKTTENSKRLFRI